MYPQLIIEQRLPGGIIEQRLPARDAASFLGVEPRSREIREKLEHLRWEGPFVLRLAGKNTRCWRRYMRLVAA